MLPDSAMSHRINQSPGRRRKEAVTASPGLVLRARDSQPRPFQSIQALLQPQQHLLSGWE